MYYLFSVLLYGKECKVTSSCNLDCSRESSPRLIFENRRFSGLFAFVIIEFECIMNLAERVEIMIIPSTRTDYFVQTNLEATRRDDGTSDYTCPTWKRTMIAMIDFRGASSRRFAARQPRQTALSRTESYNNFQLPRINGGPYIFRAVALACSPNALCLRKLYF